MDNDHLEATASVRLTRMESQILTKIAKHNVRSRSSEIRMAVQRHFRDFKGINPEVFRQFSDSVLDD